VVWSAVERLLRDPALIPTEIARRQAGTSTQQDTLVRERGSYQRQLAQCDKDLARWEKAYLAEAIDVDDFKAKRAESLARQQGITAEFAHLDEQERIIE
jgi:hypothetical protein